VRRVTPFMGAGLVALVVFADPSFSRLAWADALAVVVAAGAVAAALAPIEWDRLPRLTIAGPLVVALLLALGATFTQGSPVSLAAAAAGVLVIVGIYGVRWDGLPRWVHQLPVFGGLGAVFVIQATVHAPGYTVAPVLLVFPLYLTTVLFAALYHTRNEVWAATVLASIGILALSISGGSQPGQPAISILVVSVLWVVVLTVHAVVTDRKRTEDAVRALNERLMSSQARLQAIVDTSLNAIVSMDANGRVTDWNPQAAATFGWSRDEIVGKAVADTIIPEQYRKAHLAGLADYLATGDGPVLGRVLELTALHRTGREFPVELAISRASATGESAIFVAFLRDITTRKQAEGAINELNAELRVANRHKSEFLANMSHELRTPLNAILGFSELLLDDTKGKFDSAVRQKFLTQVNTSGRHLLGLINDILDLAKVEAGQVVLQYEAVTISDVVGQVTATIEQIASKKQVVVEAHAEAGGEVQADAGKLRQMLLNLVSNAVKFMPEGGTVTIAALRHDETVEISVADNGIGISESDLGRLFKEFQQLDTGTGRLHEGTGLGLALTKRLAELHGGDVHVTSEPGKGSTFTIELPIRQKRAGHAAPASAPKPSNGEARPVVLVVEDNDQAADLLVRQLDHGGFHGVVAGSGTEALAKARELQPVAITLDIVLPGIDGWDVLTQLKHDDATRDIPVVVVSVVDKPEIAKALGALDYFVKPVEGKALLARLANYTFTNKVATEATRVLLIDDEPINLRWLASVLKPAGYSVTSAGGGHDGIELAKSSLPDLILLDLIMPEVSGFDVVEALYADKSTRSIPIMILTAKDLTDGDKRQLNGHAKAILARGSTGGPDILAWLDRLMAKRPETSDPSS
jgi:PAS domain S-box-containing protein